MSKYFFRTKLRAFEYQVEDTGGRQVKYIVLQNSIVHGGKQVEYQYSTVPYS